jgi:hypothetical protein
VTKDDAFATLRGMVTVPRVQMPLFVGEVGIDYMVPEHPKLTPVVTAALNAALAAAPADHAEIRVVAAEILVFLKLRAGRQKDRAAVVDLIKSGNLEVDEVRGFLVAAGDEEVVSRFDKALALAEEEEP